MLRLERKFATQDYFDPDQNKALKARLSSRKLKLEREQELDQAKALRIEAIHLIMKLHCAKK